MSSADTQENRGIPPPSNVGSPDVILAGHYRQILGDIHVDYRALSYLASRAVARAIPYSNAKNISSMRSKLIEELMKPTMTWKVFIKGMAFLNATKVTVKLELNFSDTVDKLKEKLPDLRTRHRFEIEIKDSFLTQVKEINPGKYLAGVFRDAAKQSGFVGAAFDAQINKRIAARKRLGKKQSDIRNNDKKELQAEEMTWNVFLKGLELIEVQSFVIQTEIQHYAGRCTVHSLLVNLNGDSDV